MSGDEKGPWETLPVEESTGELVGWIGFWGREFPEWGWLGADRGMSIESLNPEPSKEARWLSVLRQIYALCFGRRTSTV
jgi:hypothetical protein